jgi:hypothetical protein
MRWIWPRIEPGPCQTVEDSIKTPIQMPQRRAAIAKRDPNSSMIHLAKAQGGSSRKPGRGCVLSSCVSRDVPIIFPSLEGRSALSGSISTPTI